MWFWSLLTQTWSSCWIIAGPLYTKRAHPPPAGTSLLMGWVSARFWCDKFPKTNILSPSCENKDDGYATTFLPVRNPEVKFPAQHKHFSVKMFTFIRDEEVLEDQVRTQKMAQNVLDHMSEVKRSTCPQIYFHCDAVICDSNQMEGICRRECAYPRDFSYTYPGLNRERKGECLKKKKNKPMDMSPNQLFSSRKKRWHLPQADLFWTH